MRSSSVEFVGGSVADLLRLVERPNSVDDDVHTAAVQFVGALDPIGNGFDMPWTFEDSLDVFADQLPAGLRKLLRRPGVFASANHLEACAVALALEAGLTLQPLTQGHMVRLQHTAAQAMGGPDWGRRSPHPWDTVIAADLESYDFFALCMAA